MARKVMAFVVAMLALCSCNIGTTDKNALYDIGVSIELAKERSESIKNLEYSLQMCIPENKDSAVCGRIDIGFSMKCPQEIIIDFREGEESVLGVLVNERTTDYEVRNEHIIIPAEAVREGDNSICIDFIAGDQSLNRNDEFLYTLLVPDRARTVFPCFDQPDMKASFKLVLTMPETWTAVSNSPVMDQTTVDGRKRLSFRPTEPLSTYLFSFVAGVFENRTYDDGKHTFTAYYRETDEARIAQLSTIFSQVAMSLDWMEQYTGVDYPFAKYDFIILPGFQYGGMEHTGATLYNDNSMFLSQNPTPDEELARASLIAHETAHMWFGDFVTMRWFDDVWTKEVFANYFAARITEPLFPGINHRLNWLKNITTTALSEDRTQGGTAIRQPLDNMNNAGLVYNNIIYDKAPVMLEKLIEIMGEEAFREGIHDYLAAHSYGNATWDDLIKILDNKSDKDLASFSDVWVNSKGMPFIDFRIAADTLVVTQTDPYGRGLVWPQRFSVQVCGDTLTEMTIALDGVSAKIHLDHSPLYILPNSDGRGYGYFRYDEASLEWALHNWHNIKDETCRQSQLINLHEGYQHGTLSAAAWLESLVGGLPHESNPLIASTVCNYIALPLTETNDRAAGRTLMALAKEHPLVSCRQQLLRTLIPAATDSMVCEELYRVWKDAVHPLLNINDYMTLAYELAIRNPEKQKEIVAEQADRITDADRKRQFEFIARATTPDAKEQAELFKTLLKAENRRVEPWALKTLALLCHPSREDQSLGYIREALDSLPYIQRTSDIFFPRNWTLTLLKNCHSVEACTEVADYLNSNDTISELLRSKVLQAAWNLQRRNR